MNLILIQKIKISKTRDKLSKLLLKKQRESQAQLTIQMRYRQNRTVKWRMRCKPLETNWVVMYEGRVRVTPPTRNRARPTHATAGNGPPAQKVSARATKHHQTSATTYPHKQTSSHPRLTLRRGGKQPLTPTII